MDPVHRSYVNIKPYVHTMYQGFGNVLSGESNVSKTSKVSKCPAHVRWCARRGQDPCSGIAKVAGTPLQLP